MAELITKEILAEKNLKDFNSGLLSTSNLVSISNPVLGSDFKKLSQDDMWRRTEAAEFYGTIDKLRLTGKYGSGFDIPFPDINGKTESVRDKFKRGVYGSTNTLMPDWNKLWDAMRIDITIEDLISPYLAGSIYNERTNNNFDRTMTIQQLFGPGFVFEEHNGMGQPIRMGELRGGETDTITQIIYAGGFQFDLISDLFNKNLDMGEVSKSVTNAYNAKRNDVALSPIINYSYSGAQQTPADTTSGAGRQELLYRTVENGIEDLSQRYDPVIIDQKLDTSNLIVLTNKHDAKHIVRVLTGLPSVKDNEKFPALDEVKQVIGYDKEIIQLNSENVIYDGVPDKKAYFIIPKYRYMQTATKRGLTAEVDPMPNLSTLQRKLFAWWFAQGIFFLGVEYCIQEVTLPVW